MEEGSEAFTASSFVSKTTELEMFDRSNSIFIPGHDLSQGTPGDYEVSESAGILHESVTYDLESTLQSRRALNLSFVDDDALMDGTSHGSKSPELVHLRTTPSADSTGDDTDRADSRILFPGLEGQMSSVFTVID
jgi:hypothetical protein